MWPPAYLHACTHAAGPHRAVAPPPVTLLPPPSFLPPSAPKIAAGPHLRGRPASDIPLPPPMHAANSSAGPHQRRPRSSYSGARGRARRVSQDTGMFLLLGRVLRAPTPRASPRACVSLHAPARQWEHTMSNGTRSGLAFATAVTGANASRWDLFVSSRRVCRCQTRPTRRPGARSRCSAMCKDMCGFCSGQSRASWGSWRACAGARSRQSGTSDGPGASAAQAPSRR